VFAGMAALTPWEASVTGDGEPERLGGARVSSNFFAVLGVPIVQGRDFSSDDEQPGNNRVVIISDGWDRGDVSLLEREMQDLKRRARKIIWLNPLLASENYEPLCKGMQAALPYLDLFLSVHNVNSLVSLGRTLQKMVA